MRAVVFVDIPENEIASYIVTTKLTRNTLTMGQRVALTIRLHYHAETHSAKQRQGARNDLTSTPNGVHVRTSKKLSELAHAGEGSVIRALEVYKKRTDLFGKIFDGSYSIGKAYTQMKRDEAPPTTEEERKHELDEK